MYSSFFQRHFLELSVTGELAVRMMTVGNSESQCIWSTTSCNRVLAAMREFRIHSMEILRESKAVVAEMLGEFGEEFNKLIDGSDIMKDIVAAIRAVFNSIRNVLTSIVRLIVNRGDSDSDNNTRKTRGQKKSKKNNSNGNGNSNSNDANRRRDSSSSGSSNGNNNNNKNKKDRQRQRGADDTGRYYRGYQ
jgi:Zn-dependent M32 family carboxypeptidase